MFVAHLIVQLSHILLSIVVTYPAECKFPTRIVRLRKPSRELDRRGTEQGGIDSIAVERSPQIDRSSGVAGRRGECREIAGQHGGGRDELAHVGWILTDGRTLVAAKEKKLIALDWAA